MSKKKIILGVPGGIAVYKAADLCSKLTANGFDVYPVMTENALKLISAKIFLTLSRNPVMTSLWEEKEWKPEHVALAEEADLMVVAPCTANFIGKFTYGIADDALSTTALTFAGTGKKILLAPAMNNNMWASPAVMENCRILRERKVEFVGPAEGSLACGTKGAGRMSEVPEILEKIKLLAEDIYPC